MKKYDFNLANKIISKLNNLVVLNEAEMGMKEDWFWSAQTVWSEGSYTIELNENTEIGGIKSSYWATPVIKVNFNDGEQKIFECFEGSNGLSDLDKIQQQFNVVNGCLSIPCQASINEIETENFID